MRCAEDRGRHHLPHRLGLSDSEGEQVVDEVPLHQTQLSRAVRLNAGLGPEPCPAFKRVQVSRQELLDFDRRAVDGHRPARAEVAVSHQPAEVVTQLLVPPAR